MRADPAGALEQRVHAVKISPCAAAGGRRTFDGGAAMITRRQLLKAGAVGGAALLVPWEATTGAWAAIPGGSLDPTTIAKYVAPLVIPPVMPPLTGARNQAMDRYAIAVRQFRQQILPPGLPATTVWSYGSAPHRGSPHYPAFTIEARVDRPVRIKWSNDLVDRNGRYLPHLLPVDPTLHWADPPGGIHGRDSRPRFTRTPGPYRGPVPIVTHLHGSHSTEESDGFAEAWYLPHATNIPAGYARVGSFYEEFRTKFQDRWHQGWPPGTAVFQYQNDQRATTMWFHDHTLGMTRANVYAGPAGFYLLRGGSADLPKGVLPGPAPRLGDPPGTRYYELPLAVQDRSFNRDGSLFYPASRRFFDDFAGPTSPAATSRRSLTRSSSATPWWSTAAPGHSWPSSPAAIGCGSSTAATPASCS
jgi:bilirubin oxidase